MGATTNEISVTRQSLFAAMRGLHLKSWRSSIWSNSHLPTRCILDKLGILRTTFYRWFERYLPGGPEALRIIGNLREKSSDGTRP
ncbi:hypothetical protein RUE5091_04187 [Ruegeria denitrificans]|uniref:Helix-turn-helix domain-containing protein n=1 Tax=Ruegeria denitrificans TaxID=1715692 RepID=A0A0P1IJY6_9RHOB|nr:hypothetical protein RUE5091_04187 [Ruegeria denitrificans]